MLSGTSGFSRLDILENMLQWYSIYFEKRKFRKVDCFRRIEAPTAPDTLACYPFLDRDPFVISDCPHVFFAGNQPSFATREIIGLQQQKVRLVCIPDFSTTSTVVLVNLADLSTHPITFSSN